MNYKTDCFGYKAYGNCKALTVMECEECSFYRSNQDYIKDREKYKEAEEWFYKYKKGE